MKEIKTNSKILPVLRSKEEAMEAYDRISKFYDFTEGIFEKKYINMALKELKIWKGEVNHVYFYTRQRFRIYNT